jgi:16S rRNA processing protein RimM
MSESSSSEELTLPADAVEVGAVLDAWGVKGWIRIKPFSTQPQALFSSRRWWFVPSSIPSPLADGASGGLRLLRVIAAKEHSESVIAQVDGIVDRAGAQALRGGRVLVPRSSFPSASADEYYWVDLIGTTVTNREGAVLGAVVGLIDTGPHSVLRILAEGQSGTNQEILIPFVAAFVDDVSLSEGRISVDWQSDY